MAARSTQILSIHRLNDSSKAQSIPDWWTAEKIKGSPEVAAIETAAEYLRNSDIPVGFPTETVYGLGADATRSTAVQGIYRAKQRPSDNPLIVHVDSIDRIESLLSGQHVTNGTKPASTIPSIYRPLISRFWPGPLTIILPNPPNSPLAKEVTAGLSTFGVRMPASPFARLLIYVTDRPLAAPSANASTKPSPTTAQHVYHDLKGRIDIILDGGPSGVGVESTVVDGLSNPPSILRPGGVGIDEIRACPGWENATIAYEDNAMNYIKETPRAPGMKYRHYSPKAKVILFEAGTAVSGVCERISRDIETKTLGIQSVGIIKTKIWTKEFNLSLRLKDHALHTPISSFTLNVDMDGHTNEDAPKPTLNSKSTSPLVIYEVLLGQTPESIAHGLFSALRTLDSKEVDVIYIEGIPDNDGDLAAAVMNRLRKAAIEIER